MTPSIDDVSIRRIEELIDLSQNRCQRPESALGRLTVKEREAVRLRVVEERPYPEVADLLGCSEGAARVRVHRALHRMADWVEEPDTSRIPFLDEFGDAIESAAQRAATTPSRQRGPGRGETAAFVSAILVWAVWWAMAPGADTVAADPQDTSTTAPPSLAAPGPLPTEWGRARPRRH